MVKISTIGIIGSGKMGTDIFHYLVDYDYKLYLLCENETEKEKQVKILQRKLRRQLKNDLIDKNSFETRQRNSVVTEKLEHLSKCQLIIEAINEDCHAKLELNKKLNDIVDEECILSSNSSSIIPSRLVPIKKRESKTIGLHFFYPVKMKNMVEFIYSDNTSTEVIAIIDNFLKKIKKFSLKLKEQNSFVLNKVFLEFQATAFQLLNEYDINYLQLDSIVRKNIFNMGVFDFFDSVGIDVMHNAITNYVENYKNKETFEPMLTELKKLIDQNKLGMKCGSGFYDYKNNNYTSKNQSSDSVIQSDTIAKKLKYVFLNSVFKIIENKICTEEEINYALKEYMDMDLGPVDMAKKSGNRKIHQSLMEFYEESKNEVYIPSKLFTE